MDPPRTPPYGPLPTAALAPDNRDVPFYRNRSRPATWSRADNGSAPTGNMGGYPIRPTWEVIETRAARSGGPYGVIGADSFCWNRSVIPRSLPPCPPLLRGGGSETGAGAIYRNRCDNLPCRGRHSWRPAFRLSTRPNHRRRGRRPRRPAHRLLTRPDHRRTGHCPQRPMPPITDMYRFIGTVPVTQRATGGHMGPPLQGMWNVIPFNRHGRSSKRGPPRVAAPTAFIGGNSKPATWGRRGRRPVRR